MLPDAAPTEGIGTHFSKNIGTKQIKIWDQILHFYETPEALPKRFTERRSVGATRRG